MYRLTVTVIFLIFLNNPSYAYLGPGVGVSAIIATIGIIVAIFVALFGLIWFPLKKLFKKKNNKNENNKVD
tara:strand:+ start:409 stop:621 length:213 start_codon:yes stop_codon:yes gene_type:complete